MSTNVERPKQGPGAKMVKITVLAKTDMRKFHPELIRGSEEWLEPVGPAFEAGDEFVVGGESNLSDWQRRMREQARNS